MDDQSTSGMSADQRVITIMLPAVRELVVGIVQLDGESGSALHFGWRTRVPSTGYSRVDWDCDGGELSAELPGAK